MCLHQLEVRSGLGERTRQARLDLRELAGLDGSPRARICGDCPCRSEMEGAVQGPVIKPLLGSPASMWRALVVLAVAAT